MPLTDRSDQRCISLGFMRGGDSRKAATVRLQIQDHDMKLTELIDMDPKQFSDLMSGLATWVPDGFAGHRNGAADITAAELLAIVDEYAEARAREYWQDDDQGFGQSVQRAIDASKAARAKLLEALGIQEA